MNDRAELAFDLSHDGELSVEARLRSYADLDRFIDSLYHVAFLRWPTEIEALAAVEDAGDRPAMMRAGAKLDTPGHYVDAESGRRVLNGEPIGPALKSPKKPAGGPARVALPSPPARPESLPAGVGRGGRAAISVNVDGRAFPTKRAAIVHLFKKRIDRAEIMIRVGTTEEGYKAAIKAAKRLGELPR